MAASARLQDTRIRDTAHVLEHQRAPGSKARALGPLIVATDGTIRSDAAVRAARAISAVTGQKVFVLTVHVPLPSLGPEVQLAASGTTETESRKGLLLQVLEQLDRVGITESWPVKVTTGYPAVTIAKLARHTEASLIIMGLGGHGALERIFGDEMVLQVLRVGTVPVLAVAEGFESLPTRALAAVDFSASSKRALELGGPLIAAGTASSLTLAHVIASKAESPHAGSVNRALENFVAGAEVATGVVRDRRVLTGDPATRLLELAREVRAELIITGSHGHNFLSRLLLGSVSTHLLRKAGCSILVVPPVARDLDEELPQVRGRFAFFDWTERLEEFSRRNLWRRARLEVVDPEIGAQVVEDGVTFMGAAFDARDAKVYLMFAAGTDGKQHHTHNIEDVTAIQMLRDRDGVESHLRIGHGRGQTLLTLER